MGLQCHVAKPLLTQHPQAVRAQLRQAFAHRQLDDAKIDLIIIVAQHVAETAHRIDRGSRRYLCHAFRTDLDHGLGNALQAALDRIDCAQVFSESFAIEADHIALDPIDIFDHIAKPQRLAFRTHATGRG